MSIIRPLKLTDDDEDFQTWKEFNANDDYVAAFGLAVEGNSGLLIDKSPGGNLQYTDPTEPSGREFGDIGIQADAARYTLILQHNGTVGDGTFLGYSSLIPGDDTPVIVPVDSTLIEITYSNSRSNADYTLVFRKNSTIATPFKSISKTNTQFFADTTFNETFNAGDEIYVEYQDNGGNSTDAALVLFFQVNP